MTRLNESVFLREIDLRQVIVESSTAGYGEISPQYGIEKSISNRNWEYKSAIGIIKL